jgi:hypothetical protein
MRISNVWADLNHAMARMRLGVKLTLAFGVVLAFSAVIGGTSLWRMAEVNRASSELGLHWLPAVGHASTMRAAVLEFRDFESKHAGAADDEAYMAEYEDKMAAARSRIETELTGYKALSLTDKEVALLAEFDKAWAAYQAINKNVVAMARRGEAADAKDVSDGAALMAADETILAVDALSELGFTSGRASAEAANATYRSAMMMVVGLLGDGY